MTRRRPRPATKSLPHSRGSWHDRLTRAIPGAASRLFWLRLVLALAFISGVLLAPKLWLSSRFYPLTPLFTVFPAVPPPLDLVLLLGLLLSLAATTVFPHTRAPVIASLVAAGALMLLDQSRLQPWVYQYVFMLAAFAFHPGNPSDPARYASILDPCRLVVASIYFWSGVQKLNLTFVAGVFPWLLQPFVQHLPEPARIPFYALGAAVPFVEAGIGLALLTGRYRRQAVFLSLAMHAVILLALSPVGHDWNRVVWPWNLAMGALVVILFWRTGDVARGGALLAKRRPAFHYIVLVLFGIMPAFSFFNLWDSYLSSTLYSGNIREASLYMSDPVKSRLPGELQRLVLREDGQHRLGVSEWSHGELNVPAYPETRVFRNIARHLCRYASGAGDVTLVIQEKPDWLTGARERERSGCLLETE